MNPRERVWRTLHHLAPDRPPADGTFRAEVWENLRTHFGTRNDDQIMDILGIDFRRAFIEPPDEFTAIAAPAPGAVGVGSRNLARFLPNGEFQDDRGIRRVLDSTGSYFNYTYHPLASAGSPDAYVFPSTDRPERYAHVRRQVNSYKGRYMIQVETGNVFRDAWELRGFEQFLMDMYLDPQFAAGLLERITQHKIAEVRHVIEAGADIIQMAGDIATQQGMMISPDWWRAEVKPRLGQVIAATRRRDVYFYFHSDGAMQEVIPDLIEIGFDIVDPVQPECMDPVALKRRVGGHITLHSTLSSQRTLPFGTPADVRAEVRARINECGQDGGLILAPSNVVQHDVPIDNLVALYDEITRSSA
jgi:uroporphyrinogen decarboxylase